jgi:hypothetical protein
MIYTCIYINDLSNESEISNDGLSNKVSDTTATNITCTRGYNVVNCIESNNNHLGLVTILVEVASLVYQVLCMSYVLVLVVSGEGSSTHCQH